MLVPLSVILLHIAEVPFDLTILFAVVQPTGPGSPADPCGPVAPCVPLHTYLVKAMIISPASNVLLLLTSKPYSILTPPVAQFIPIG
jgi:hypothetical protein